jgi:hypothetical protein
VVTASFAGVDSFDKTRFMFIVGHLPTFSWETNKRGRSDVSPFHLIAHHYTGIMVVSTVVTSSFVGGDSFENTRF